MRPALFAETTAAMRISREEVFGPVVSVIRAKNDEEALALANESEFGLCAGITHDLPQVRDAFQAPRTGRCGDGEAADRGRGLPRAPRRSQRLQLRAARAGPVRRGAYTTVKTAYAAA